VGGDKLGLGGVWGLIFVGCVVGLVGVFVGGGFCVWESLVVSGLFLTIYA